MQIKTMIRCCHTPIRIAKIIKTTNNIKFWWACGKTGFLMYCDSNVKVVLLHWKTVWQFLIKLRVHLPHNPTTVLSGINSKEMKTCACVLIFQSRPTLCDPMDCSPPGSSVHGILQARILEWDAIPPPPRGIFWPRDQTHISYVSCIGRWVLYHKCHLGSPTQKPTHEHSLQLYLYYSPKRNKWNILRRANIKANWYT